MNFTNFGFIYQFLCPKPCQFVHCEIGLVLPHIFLYGLCSINYSYLMFPFYISSYSNVCITDVRRYWSLLLVIGEAKVILNSLSDWSALISDGSQTRWIPSAITLMGLVCLFSYGSHSVSIVSIETNGNSSKDGLLDSQ